ncbi:MAG: polysaccharide lyase family 7 protein, partial [Spirochaetia bacterium]|nr:polysaccharide lyase family 7 protein [Spirochaetia bacterium]
NPDEVQPSVLKGSYQNSPYFHTGSDGAMVFWCPVNGVTTPGSTHPRTELRELMTGVNGDTSHNWKPGQFTKSRLMATVAVHRVPSGTLDVCIGQVHQFGNRPFVILHYKNGTVFARIYNTTNANTALTTLSFGNMALDTKFTYELLISATTIHVYVNGVHKTYPIDATWKTQDLYFKAGLYCLDGGTSSTDGGEAYFYSLSLYHGG